MPAFGNLGPIPTREPPKPTRSFPNFRPPAPRTGVMREAKALSSPRRLTEARPVLPGLRQQAQRELHQTPRFNREAQQAKRPQGSSGGVLGTILNIPGRIEAQGYKNLASITGVPQLSKIGNLAAEAVNLPTQVFPAAYQAGKAVRGAVEGKPKELHELVHQFTQESPFAHLVKGDFGGAVAAAGRHPIGSALEAGGVASAVDRALGAAGRSAVKDTSAAAGREYPRTATPEGGSTVPQRPYHPGLIRPTLEKRIHARPIPTGKVPKRLRESYDRFQGEQLRASRTDRETIQKTHREIRKGVAGQGAIVPFGQWMADPKILGPDGTPLYKQHLQEMIEHLGHAPAHELPHEQLIRETAREHLQKLQADPKFQAHPEQAYKAAQQVAQEKQKLVPELAQHRVLSRQMERIAKLIPAFQFHFRDQNPFVDTMTQPGESPFKLEGPDGKPIPVDEVARRLEAKGIHESQLSFVSTKPHQSETAAYTSGYRPGGAKQSPGHLTGYNFMRGQFDPTPEAALRQHLTDQAIINRARGDLRFSKEYVHSREQIAKLLEAKINTLDPEHRASMRQYIQDELRTGPGVHFTTKAGRSPWQRATLAHEQLQRLHPNIDLAPIRVAHPYATGEYRKGMGEHLAASMDVREPDKYGPEHDFWTTRVPTETAGQNDITAGPVGLAHSEITARARKYEADLGQAHLSRLPSSFWRKTNVAFSVRHLPGVTQEILMRDLANNMGVISALRGTRASGEMLKMAEDSRDPFVKLSGQRIRGMTRGTVASFTQEQARHITKGQMEATRLAKPADWWVKGTQQPITGPPLKAIQGGLKAFNRFTNGILTLERKAVEHPLQQPGVGKHLNNEFRRMHGKNLKLAGQFSDLEKRFMAGQLDPKAVDHMANQLREYYGDWTRASPEFKSAQRVSPFAQWYLNSARFVYHVMPVHHPVKTGLLAAIEGATRQERLAEGQEYKGGLPFGSHLLPTDLEPGQQGSLPFGKGERMAQEYYSPQGFISKGPLSTVLENVFPYASGLYMIANGTNPLTHRPLEETVEGKKQRITDANQLGLLAATALAEGFAPPVRYATQLAKSPAGHVFRPFRTERTRTESPTRKEKGTPIGGKIREGIGGSIGGKLP